MFIRNRSYNRHQNGNRHEIIFHHTNFYRFGRPDWSKSNREQCPLLPQKFQVSRTDRFDNDSDNKISRFKAIKISTTARIALDRKSKTKKETKIANQSLSQTLCRKLRRFKRISGVRFNF